MTRSRYREDQEGQALLSVLIAVTLLSLVGAAMTALWLRGVILAQRRAEGVAALYAAEAGIARGMEELVAGRAAGPATWQGSVGTPPFDASFTGRFGPRGDGTYELVSTGVKGRSRRTVRVVVATPFFFPLYAADILKIRAVPSPHEFVHFSSAPAYGSKVEVDDNVSPQPVKLALDLPRIPFAAFAEAAGQMLDLGTSLPGLSDTLTKGWYEGGRGCDDWPRGEDRTVTVAAGAVAGIAGDVHCGSGTLVIKAGATLVITDNLKVGGLVLEDGARLITGGNFDVGTVELRVTPAGTGGALVAVGGSVVVSGIDEVVDATGLHPLIILALDRRGCTAPACGQDDNSNDITINNATATEFVVYAGPLPHKPPQVFVEYGAKAKNGIMEVRGTVVSAGDLELRVHQGSLEFQADPAVVGRLMALTPGAGIWTQLHWVESGG